MTTRELVDKLVAAVDSPNFGPREETLLAEARAWLADFGDKVTGELIVVTRGEHARIAAEARRAAFAEVDAAARDYLSTRVNHVEQYGGAAALVQAFRDYLRTLADAPAALGKETP